MIVFLNFLNNCLIDFLFKKVKLQNKSWLSSEVIKKVKKHLDKKDQVLFFLNRRGFSPFVFCKKCLNTYLCPNCSINLVYHKKKNNLLCHYCGFKSSLNRKCKDNSSCDFIFCGPGVERIAEELKIQFPKKKISIFSSDTLKKKDSKIIIDNLEYFFLVYNASRKKIDEEIFINNTNNYLLLKDHSLLAIQGPLSSHAVSNFYNNINKFFYLISFGYIFVIYNMY